MQSFRDIDPRLEAFRTGDLALSCRDDIPGIFILFFTRSLFEHAAIACWVDRDTYESERKIVFKPRNESNDLLMFAHITKRKMFDHLTQTKRSGLLLCSLDEFCQSNLIAIWRRGLTPEISDKVALECFKRYILVRSLELEYENDIRTILGVPINYVHAPYEHRKICTAMVCDYLARSYGFPFLISREGDMEKISDLESREVNFKLPKRDFAVYRALDFQYQYNESPVLEQIEEQMVYGFLGNFAKSSIHPINIIFITILTITVLFLVWLALARGYNQTK